MARFNVPVEEVVVPSITMINAADPPSIVEVTFHDRNDLWQVSSHFVSQLLGGKLLGDQDT